MFSPAWRTTHYCQLGNFAMKATPLHLRLTRSQFTTRTTSKSYWTNTGLWRINLQQEHQQHSPKVENTITESRNTGALVNYLHKAMFCRTKYALLQAVKNGHLITWPGLTEQSMNKHLKMMPVTAMGNMNQLRQNIRSTSKASITSDMEDEAVTPAGLGSKTHFVYRVVVDEGKLYTYLTGKFLVISSKGNWYVMICY
jgi:hypothetical protein